MVVDRTALAALAAETVELARAGRYGSVPPSVLYLPDDPLPVPGPVGESTVETMATAFTAAAALVASVLLRQSVRGQGSAVQQPADRLQDVRVEGAVDVPEEGEGVARVAEERA